MTRKSLCVAVLSAFFFLCCPSVSGQPMEAPGDEGGGGMGAEPVKPEAPVKPVPPKPLELPVDWLESRKLLLDVCDSILESQFKDVHASSVPAVNPLVQQLREYISEKSIVTYWANTRPLGISWTYPVPEPKETVKEIETRLTWQLTQESEEKYPLLNREEYLRQAERTYRMYRVGETVEIPLLQGGRGVIRKRRGRLMRVGNGQIRLAPRTFISRQDISDEVAARFFHRDHVRMVQRYADNAVVNCNLDRRNYVQSNLRVRLKQKLLENNYVPNFVEHLDTVSTSIFKVEHWCSRRMLVLKFQLVLWRFCLGKLSMHERMLAAIAGDREPSIKPMGQHIQDEFMERHGFQLLDEKQGKVLRASLRKDEMNRHVGWVLRDDVRKMEQWLKENERYHDELQEYMTKYKEYEENLATYKKEKAEYDRRQAAAAAAGDGEEEEDEDE